MRHRIVSSLIRGDAAARITDIENRFHGCSQGERVAAIGGLLAFRRDHHGDLKYD